MADLGVFGPLGGALILYFGIGRRIVYSLYMMAGAVLLAREGRQFSEAEAREYGRTLVWKSVADFIVLRWSAIDWPGLAAGCTHIVSDFRFHAQTWVRGWQRDIRKAREWCVALFQDKEAEAIALRKAQYDDAALRRNALAEVTAYDFEPTPWLTQAVDIEHDRARRDYDELARKPGELSGGEALMLADLIRQLRRYGDNPLALRRESAPAPIHAFAGASVLGAGKDIVQAGLAWGAPRLLVFSIGLSVALFFYARGESIAKVAAQTAEQTVRATMVATAKALDESRTTIAQTREQCIAEITKAAEATKTKLAAESAARKRRQARAQEQAASGGAAPILDPREWMRGISGQGSGDGTAAPTAPNPGPVSDAGPGPAAAGDQGHVSNEPGSPAEGAGGGR